MFTNDEKEKIVNKIIITGKLNDIKIITTHNNKIIISGKIHTLELSKKNKIKYIPHRYTLLFDNNLIDKIQYVNYNFLVKIEATVYLHTCYDHSGSYQDDNVLFVSDMKFIEPEKFKSKNTNIKYLNHDLNGYSHLHMSCYFIDICSNCNIAMQHSNIANINEKNKICFDCQPIDKLSDTGDMNNERSVIDDIPF